LTFSHIFGDLENFSIKERIMHAIRMQYDNKKDKKEGNIKKNKNEWGLSLDFI
jgi:hypothetical protein